MKFDHLIWLYDYLYFMRYWSNCDDTNFEINLIFLIKSFFYMIKMLRQKIQSLKEKAFKKN